MFLIKILQEEHLVQSVSECRAPVLLDQLGEIELEF